MNQNLTRRGPAPIALSIAYIIFHDHAKDSQ